MKEVLITVHRFCSEHSKMAFTVLFIILRLDHCVNIFTVTESC